MYKMVLFVLGLYDELAYYICTFGIGKILVPYEVRIHGVSATTLNAINYMGVSLSFGLKCMTVLIIAWAFIRHYNKTHGVIKHKKYFQLKTTNH